MIEACTIGDAVRSIAHHLEQVGIDDAVGEARLIVGHTLDLTRSEVIGRKDEKLSETELISCRSLTKRRSAKEPMAYLLGEKEFWSLPFKVSQETLIPRPDSETLISAVLDYARNVKTPKRLLDIGTGSGCLLAALLSEWPEATGIGIDSNDGAVFLAGQNLDTLGMVGRCSILAATWPAYRPGEKFDLVIANPPYIPTVDIPTLDPDVRDYEPLSALDGGPDGLAIHREIAHHAEAVLKPGGLIAVEFGIGQSWDIQSLYGAAGFDPMHIQTDLSGTDRCLLATITN